MNTPKEPLPLPASGLFGDWQPIATIPNEGYVLVWLPDTELPWPGYARDGKAYSNSHGLLNDPKDKWSSVATHWMPLPSAPNAVALPTASENDPNT